MIDWSSGNRVIAALCIIATAAASVPCTDVIYAPDGYVSVSQTLNSCLSNISDPLMPPSTRNNATATTINIQYLMSNLQAINEVDGTAGVDFFLRLGWIDERLHFPSLWEALDPRITTQGADILQSVKNELIDPGLWLPDLLFLDSISELCNGELEQEYLRMYPPEVSGEGSRLLWSRHFVCIFQQPHFDYKEYPTDEQYIHMRLQSYGSTDEFVHLAFYDPPVTFVMDANGDSTFKQNAIWEYNKYEAKISVNDRSVGSIRRVVDVAIVNIYLTRDSAGIILRLGVPIVLCVVVSCVAFWASVESRLDITITLLLAVSALYIVIFGNIPLLGYLTKMDTFVIVMFVILIINAFIHLLTMRCLSKEPKWPLRGFIARCFECVGRLCMLPIVIFFYQYCFGDATEPVFEALYATFVVIYVTSLGFREIMGCRAKFKYALIGIDKKITTPGESDVSMLEMFLHRSYNAAKKDMHVPRPSLSQAIELSRSVTAMKGDSDDEEDVSPVHK